ncbi:MAG: hypothetical protein NTZ64_07065 [Polaromonas sp.]|nr:hypothetical protein [Polaromonas sp.]
MKKYIMYLASIFGFISIIMLLNSWFIMKTAAALTTPEILPHLINGADDFNFYGIVAGVISSLLLVFGASIDASNLEEN